jgi:CRISPR system Cascade subunit CasC
MGRRSLTSTSCRSLHRATRNANATAWPTSTSYGGVRRARISIEQCSYVVRAEFARAIVDALLGERSVRTGQAIAEPVMAIPPWFRDQASAFARTVLTAANLVEDEPRKTHAESPRHRLSAAWAVREGGTR